MKGSLSDESMAKIILAVLVTGLIISIIGTVATGSEPLLTGCNNLLTGLSNALGETLC